MTFGEFTNAVSAYWSENPQQRAGQALFNTLYHVRGDLAARIRSTNLDPFYEDDLVSATMDWLKENW